MTNVLRNRVKALEVEVNHANDLLQTRLSSVESLKETLLKRKKAMKSLRSDLLKANHKNYLLEQRLEEVAQLQQFVAAERDELHASHTRAEEAAQGEIASLKLSLEALRADLDQARTREAMLMNAAKQQEDLIMEAQRRSSDLEATVQLCQESHAETREKLSMQQHDNETLLRHNSELRTRISELESRMESAVQMLQGDTSNQRVTK